MTELQNVTPYGNEPITQADFAMIDHDKKIVHLYDTMPDVAGRYMKTLVSKAKVIVRNNGTLSLTAEGTVWQHDFGKLENQTLDYHHNAETAWQVRGPFNEYRSCDRRFWEKVNIATKTFKFLWLKKTVEVYHGFAWKIEKVPVDIQYHGWELRKHK